MSVLLVWLANAIDTWHAGSVDKNAELGDGSTITDVVEDWDEDEIEKMLAQYAMDQFGTVLCPLHSAGFR